VKNSYNVKRIRTSTPKLKTKPEVIPEKPKKISTIEIEESLARYFNFRVNIIVPNISWGFHGSHEMDLLVLKKSGYCSEIEIKISFSDLKADFKKEHEHKSKYIREFYYAFPSEFYEKFEPLIPKHAGIIVCERNKYNEIVFSKLKRKATINTLAKKLTIDDQMKIRRLGCLRIFSLKKKIILLQKQISELK